jgi:hypothetical protein
MDQSRLATTILEVSQREEKQKKSGKVQTEFAGRRKKRFSTIEVEDVAAKAEKKLKEWASVLKEAKVLRQQ